MTLTELATIVGIISAVCGGIGYALRFTIKAFHDEQVAPAIAGMTNALTQNSAATTSLTAQLAASNEKEQQRHDETREILQDHEARIRVVEDRTEPPPKPPAAMRAGRKRVA